MKSLLGNGARDRIHLKQELEKFGRDLDRLQDQLLICQIEGGRLLGALLHVVVVLHPNFEELFRCDRPALERLVGTARLRRLGGCRCKRCERGEAVDRVPDNAHDFVGVERRMS